MEGVHQSNVITMAFMNPKGQGVFVQLNAAGTVKFLNGLSMKIPKIADASSQEFGFALRRNLRANITRQGLKHTGYLWNNTRWVKKGKRSYLSMPAYGPALDSMRPHALFVGDKRTRISRWVRDKAPQLGNARFITVHAHPFIERPLLVSLSRLHGTVAKNVRGMIKSG